MKKRCLALLLTLVLCIGMAIPAGASQFQDVPDDHWASDAVDYVVEKGLFNGTSATTFSPDRTITRVQVAVMLMRFDGAYGEVLLQQAVLALVNEARAQEGLAPLTLAQNLTQAAQVRAGELPVLFSHTRPDGRSCFTALAEAGVAYRTAGENIAAGYATPEAVVDGWLHSEGHRANILNEDFTQMGVGHVQAADGYGDYWVQLFVG